MMYKRLIARIPHLDLRLRLGNDFYKELVPAYLRTYNLKRTSVNCYSNNSGTYGLKIKDLLPVPTTTGNYCQLDGLITLTSSINSLRWVTRARASRMVFTFMSQPLCLV